MSNGSVELPRQQSACRHRELTDSVQEDAWVRSSQKGDAVAFNRLVLKWERSIYNIALRMLESPEEAEDATQEVFLSAYKSIGKFRRRSRFSTWLYRIAVNRCITRLRCRPQGIHRSLDSDHLRPAIDIALPATNSHEAELLREEARRMVRDALRHLSPLQKAVVELKFFQGLTLDEVASAMQEPLSTVKSRLYTALGILKSRLGRTCAG